MQGRRPVAATPAWSPARRLRGLTAGRGRRPVVRIRRRRRL